MKILLVSATVFEMGPLLAHLEQSYVKKSFFEFQNGNTTVFPLVTGVGMVNTTFALARFKSIPEIDLAINLGIAGSYRKNLTPGTVVEVVKDRFADLGVEESNGDFTDVYDLELVDRNLFPFEDGWIAGKHTIKTELQQVAGLTVNKVSGTQQTIDKITTQYNADIESMEGAAFLYACRSMDIKCLQLRSISNFIEPRNKENWRIDLAIEALNQNIIELLAGLESK